MSWRGKAKLRVKFCDDRMNGSEIIKVFVNFKMAVGGHLVLLILLFLATDVLRIRS